MSERTGIYSILKVSWLYDFWHYCVGANDAFRTFSREYLRPEWNEKILDIGCGTGKFADFLPENTGYMGCDMNASYIETARATYPKRGPFWQARLERRQLFMLPECVPKDYSVVLSCCVGHHLNDEEFLRLMETAHNLLTISSTPSRFVLYDNCLTNEQSTFSRWLTLQDRGRYPRHYESQVDLLNKYFASVTAQVRTDLYRLPTSIIIAEAKL